MPGWGRFSFLCNLGSFLHNVLAVEPADDRLVPLISLKQLIYSSLLVVKVVQHSLIDHVLDGEPVQIGQTLPHLGLLSEVFPQSNLAWCPVHLFLVSVYESRVQLSILDRKQPVKQGYLRRQAPSQVRASHFCIELLANFEVVSFIELGSWKNPSLFHINFSFSPRNLSRLVCKVDVRVRAVAQGVRVSDVTSGFCLCVSVKPVHDLLDLHLPTRTHKPSLKATFLLPS